MSYNPKKENVSKLNRFLYIQTISKELDAFHKKNVYERYDKAEEEIKDGLYKDILSNRIVYWNTQKEKEVKTIGANPTKELAKTRLDNIRATKDCTPAIFNAMVEYIKMEFEHTMNLGHSEAFIYLNNLEQDSVDLVHPTPLNTFEFKGDLKHFYKQCIEYEVIDSKTSLDSFTMAFDGLDIRDFNEFQFKFKQDNHCVYFFDQLNEKKLINQKYVQNNKVIEKLCNIKNVHSKRENYKNNKKGGEKEGTPKGIDYINELINSLK